MASLTVNNSATLESATPIALEKTIFTIVEVSLSTPPIPMDSGLPLDEPSTLNFIASVDGCFHEVINLTCLTIKGILVAFENLTRSMKESTPSDHLALYQEAILNLIESKSC